MTIKELQDYITKFCNVTDWKEESIIHGCPKITFDYTFIRIAKLRALIVGLEILGVPVSVDFTILPPHIYKYNNCEFDIVHEETGYELEIFLSRKSKYWID